MVNEYLLWPVLTFQLSSLFVAIAVAFFNFSKGGKAKIAPHLRQLGAIWFAIACSLAVISLVNLIAKISGIRLEHLVLGGIGISVIVGILITIFQLIRLTAPSPPA